MYNHSTGYFLILFKFFYFCNILGSSADIPILDPVFKYYQPHEGELLGVRFSPNRKDMFMSYATDGEIRIYMVDEVCILKKKPTMMFALSSLLG